MKKFAKYEPAKQSNGLFNLANNLIITLRFLTYVLYSTHNT
jgi:hypothetical protein